VVADGKRRAPYFFDQCGDVPVDGLPCHPKDPLVLFEMSGVEKAGGQRWVRSVWGNAEAMLCWDVLVAVSGF